MQLETVYSLLAIVTHIAGPLMPADSSPAAIAAASSAIVAEYSDGYVTDYGLTLDDCQAALEHLPRENSALTLAVTSDGALLLLAFACDNPG